MEAWQTILLAFGGNAALLAVLGWLSKSLVEKLLTKDIERFKQTLRSETDTAIERLRHDLQIVAFEHQTRFSKLHEKRASVIAELYANLVQAYWDANSFVSPMEWAGEPNKQQKYTTAMNSVAEFFRFFDKHRIYLPEELCTQIEQFVRSMREKVIHFGVYVGHPDGSLPHEALEKKHKAWTDSWEYFEKQVPVARAALEHELRGMLGAK